MHILISHIRMAIPIKSTVLLLLALLVIVLLVLKRKKKQKLRGLPELKMRTQLMGAIYSKFCCEEEQSSTVVHSLFLCLDASFHTRTTT